MYFNPAYLTFCIRLLKYPLYGHQTLLDDKLEPLRLTDEQLEDFSLMLTSQPCSSVEAESSCQRTFPAYAMPGAIVDDLSEKEWEREQRRLSNERTARQSSFYGLGSPTTKTTAPKSPTDTPIGTSRENSWQTHQAWLPANSGEKNGLSASPVVNEKEVANSFLRVAPLARKAANHQSQNQEVTHEW